MANTDKVGDSSSTFTIIPLDTYNNEIEIDKLQRSIVISPLPDHIGIVLVWQNLIVSTREGRRRRLLQKMKICEKKFQPKRQILLNNISGHITGGLCAVMGKFSF